MITERIKATDIPETVQLIERSVRSPAFASFYPSCSLEYVIGGLDYEGVKEKMETTHFYVMREDGRIVGCGGIGPYCNSMTESELNTIFIDPDYQGKSYGRKLIGVLECDEYAKRARRIEVPAAISAVPFYKKMGYQHKNEELIYDDGQIILEKYV